jgi:hypothetical protein
VPKCSSERKEKTHSTIAKILAGVGTFQGLGGEEERVCTAHERTKRCSVWEKRKYVQRMNREKGVQCVGKKKICTAHEQRKRGAVCGKKENMHSA